MKHKMKVDLKESKGITLIALIITIIVLIILAGVSISILLGENGIINKAQMAKVESSHATVKDTIQMKYAEYLLEKSTGETTQTLIEYLKDKEHVINETAEEGKYLIDVEKLVGSKQALGNGKDGKTDVYMLEEVTEETEKLGEVATTEPIKLANATSTSIEKQYKVIYYGKVANENKELDILKDNVISEQKLITFYIGLHNAHEEEFNKEELNYVAYSAYEGCTWKEWISSTFYDFGNYMYINEGKVMYMNDPVYYRENDEICLENDEIEKDGYYYGYFAYGECVYPNANVLVSKEGKTVEAKDIIEGNDIAYYNFETNTVEIGKVEKVYIHKQATSFVKYTFEDGSYLEATDYHPIYTEEGWKSYTRRNGYEVPKVGDKVKTQDSWKKLVSIESFEGLEDCYDFEIVRNDGTKVTNYFANGTLVQGSY